VKYNVPFIANSEDDLHCLQAAFMMILKYFESDTEIDWDDWSEMTGFEIGKGTYATAGVLWFLDNGFDVKEISLFDCKKFIETGGDYLIETSGKDVGEWQIVHSNIPLEQERMKKLLSSGAYDQREPTIDDIKQFLDKGYLLRVLVNSIKLNGKYGYFGHAVVVFGYENEYLLVHDPGSPPMPNRKVSFDDFEAAWADPSKDNKEMDAIKLINQ
jgi:hypothetical protein